MIEVLLNDALAEMGFATNAVPEAGAPMRL